MENNENALPDVNIKDVIEFQKKMHELRKDIVKRGYFVNDAKNDFDNYKYFSEAKYKMEANELFTNHGIEYRSSEVAHEVIQGTAKQPFGFLVTYEFCLKDIDTGYMEVTYHSGVGMDKGDKAIYKARTGAFKSFMANTFLFPTSDDPENDEDEKKPTTKAQPKKTVAPGSITQGQIALIKSLFKDSKEELKEMMTPYNKKKIEELSVEEASTIIDTKKGGASNE